MLGHLNTCKQTDKFDTTHMIVKKASYKHVESHTIELKVMLFILLG